MPMTFEDARAAVYAKLDAFMQANYPAVPVQYENRANVDVSNLTGPVVVCELAYGDGEQKSLEQAPIVRYQGAIWLNAGAKEGEGTADSLGILSALASAFKTTSFGGVVTQAPRPVPGAKRLGLYFIGIRVPFYFDDIP